jgi:hypothetical protein
MAVGDLRGRAAMRFLIVVRRRRISHIDWRLTPIGRAIAPMDIPAS